MLPYGLPQGQLNSLLAKTSADHVIAEAGTLDLDDLATSAESIKTVIWVTRINEHMGFTDGGPDTYTVTSWHDLVEKNHRSANSEVLPLDKDSQVPPVSIFIPAANGGYDLVKYTSEVSQLPDLPSSFLDGSHTALRSILIETTESRLRDSRPAGHPPTHPKARRS